MFKLKYFLPASFASILLLSSAVAASASASASEIPVATDSISSTQEYALQLDDLTTISTPYDPALFDFVRSETPTELTVNVVDRSSGRIVSTYGEKVVAQKSPAKVSVMATGTYTTRTVYRTYTDAGYNGQHFAGADLYTVYNCWQNGSFGQINSVSNTYWSPMPGNSDFYLESPNAQSSSTGSTGTYPTNQVTTTGTVVLTTLKKEAFGVSLSLFNYTLTGDSYSRYAIRNAAYNINFGG